MEDRVLGNFTNATENSTARHVCCDLKLDNENFRIVVFVSGIYMGIISPLTVLANGLLLVAVFKDPFNCLRTAITIFIITLAIADLLTGLAVDPIFAYVYIAIYGGMKGSSYHYQLVFRVGKILSTLTMNISILVVLVMSWVQLLAVSYPHKHRRFITRKVILSCVAAICFYATLFSLSLLMGVPDRLFLQIDLYLNSTLVVFLLLTTYALLHVSFNRQNSHNKIHFRRRDSVISNIGRRQKSKRKFKTVNLLLILCVLVCIAPLIVMWYLSLHLKMTTKEQKNQFNIAGVLINNLLFLKFLFDPFIYAWRSKKYREALQTILPFWLGSKGRRTDSMKSDSGAGRRTLSFRLSRLQYSSVTRGSQASFV